MMTQQERYEAGLETPLLMSDLAAWIAAWPVMRHDFEALLEAYEQACPEFDGKWMLGALEEFDANMRQLSHRTSWLMRQIAQMNTAS